MTPASPNVSAPLAGAGDDRPGRRRLAVTPFTMSRRHGSQSIRLSQDTCRPIRSCEARLPGCRIFVATLNLPQPVPRAEGTL